METKSKVTSLGLLRGLAVLLVCFCHFAAPLTGDKILGSVFKALVIYGKYGVHIFFVISGFIIPLSMDKARYSIKYYFNFLAKRAVRLHPPYIAAIALTLIIVLVANHVKNIPFPETPLSIFQSFFYIHAPADNAVFWTLKIEAEYYVFMGLYFAILNINPKLTLLVSIPLVMILSQTQLINYIGLFDFLIFFLIGTVGYLIYKKNNFQSPEFICLLSLIIFSFCFYDIAASIAATFTITFILLYRKKVHNILELGGEISYSVYLIHFPIGEKIINLLSKHINPSYNIVLFILTIPVVFALSLLFWKFIEQPFAQLSNNIKYGKNKPVVDLLINQVPT